MAKKQVDITKLKITDQIIKGLPPATNEFLRTMRYKALVHCFVEDEFNIENEEEPQRNQWRQPPPQPMFIINNQLERENHSDDDNNEIQDNDRDIPWRRRRQIRRQGPAPVRFVDEDIENVDIDGLNNLINNDQMPPWRRRAPAQRVPANINAVGGPWERMNVNNIDINNDFNSDDFDTEDSEENFDDLLDNFNPNADYLDIHDLNIGNNQDQVGQMTTEYQKETFFWATIEQFGWKNASDGMIDNGLVKRIMKNMTNDQRKVFNDIYQILFDNALAKINTDGLFDRNGITSGIDRAKIVSHVIALGQEPYQNLIDDMELLQFLVIAGECQSLDDIIS